MNIKANSGTDVGKVRKLNEDSFGIDEEMNLYFVCDGMGGHAAGDFASQTGVKTLIDCLKSEDIRRELCPIHTGISKTVPDKAARLVTAIQLVNRRLFNFTVEYPKLRGMGTTVASILFDNNLAYIGHVGDSRVYRIRNNKIERLTADHSWVNELLQDGEITEAEVKDFKQKNVITRALGTRPSVKVDLRIEQVQNNDYYILCSDGLCGFVDDSRIKDIVLAFKDNLQTVCNILIQSANDADGQDNITVIAINVSDVSNPVDIKVAVSQMSNPLTISDEDENILNKEDELLKRMYVKEKLVALKDAAVARKEMWRNPLYISVAGLVFVSLIVLGVKQPWKKKDIPSPVPVVAPERLLSITINAKAYITKELEGGEVTIVEELKGVEVTIDEIQQSKYTPNAIFTDLKPGTYHYHLKKDGYIWLNSLNKKKLIETKMLTDKDISVTEYLEKLKMQ
ncbi:MAG: Stp1/IreP family PP2C-type Ser/Thr phosphatase [Elusimicrobiota bacterium]